MCAVVFLGEESLETQGALKAALGPIIYLEEAPAGAKDDDQGCLCWVNVTQMAERQGVRAIFDGVHWLLLKT